MKNSKQIQIFTLIIFSFVLLFSIIEGSLRIAGFVLLKIQKNQNIQGLSDTKTLRIMCLGESTTFVGGENSYPSQLENILNNQLKNKEVKVINKGVPGITTDFIAGNLKGWLEEFQPHIVVVMMGINDPPESSAIEEIVTTVNNQTFISNLRTVKLVKWIAVNVKERLINKNKPEIKMDENVESVIYEPPLSFQEQVYANIKNDSVLKKIYSLVIASEAQGKFDQAEKLLVKLKAISKDRDMKYWFYLKYINTLFEQKKYIQLEHELQDFSKTDSSHPDLARWLKRLYEQSPSSIDVMIKKFMSLLEDKNNDISYYDLIENAYFAKGNLDQAFVYANKAKIMRSKLYSLFTKSNYVKLAKILSDKNVSSVLVQYPRRDVNTIKAMLSEEVDISKFLFVDNQDSFNEALKSEPFEEYFYDRFAGNFGHCTKKGNELLAGNIAKKIMKSLLK